MRCTQSTAPWCTIAPDELSFVEAQAWKDHPRPRRQAQISQGPPSPPTRTPTTPNTLISRFRGLIDRHYTLRKTLSHAFSDPVLHGQGTIIGDYVMELMKELEKAGGLILSI
ncbi:hypothetical protein F4782DRAFT_416572 [Xylaria castorea]|nr:hypothetical protein F4782DRAFT_416572 [Xylaria castorea]